MVTQEALNNVDKAEFIIQDVTNNNLKDKIDRIHDDSTRAKQLVRDSSNSHQEVRSSMKLLDSISLEDIKNKLMSLTEKREAINASSNSLYEKINNLKNNINQAREIANSIRIGLTFFPNTTLELKNPESLPLQTTSTKISFYFRTPKSNGLLMFLGNENRTNAPRVKSVRLNKKLKTKCCTYIFK